MNFECMTAFLFQIPIECFEEPWVIFRGKDGEPGCVQNTCAHRACPLHLGSVNEGRIQCPYHGMKSLKQIKTNFLSFFHMSIVDLLVTTIQAYLNSGLFIEYNRAHYAIHITIPN